MKNNWTEIDEKLFMNSIIAGAVIGGIGLFTGITFLTVIGASVYLVECGENILDNVNYEKTFRNRGRIRICSISLFL